MPSKLSLKLVQDFAIRMGGVCLATDYVNNRTKLPWACSSGHRWEASFHHVKDSGSWCPECLHRVPLPISEAKALGASRGGVCLTDDPEFLVSRSKLEWSCRFHHQWEATFSSVRSGRWCPKCAGKRKTIGDMHEMAAKNGGACVSQVYIPNTDLDWMCEKGHVFTRSPTHVRSGHWCPICAGRGRTINDVRELAKSKGGECLSEVYVSGSDNFHWRCGKGHTWWATYENVRRTSWCPNCKMNKREKQCRLLFEEIFAAPFPKLRPSWLRNSRGNQMELDGYSEMLRIAFEYNGFQHYGRSHFQTEEEFRWQQQKDEEKKSLCVENKVNLIEVPWSTKSLREFVLHQHQSLLGKTV